jgi:succinate dehydrogenase/fumarate reductase flavoprotein subunit
MGSSRFGERLFGRLLGHHAARYAASISGSIFIGLSRAIERHRQAYDVFMDTWGQTNWATVYDRIKTD